MNYIARQRPVVAAAAATLVGAALLAGCSSAQTGGGAGEDGGGTSATSSSGGAYTVLAILPLTGQSESIGQTEKIGLEVKAAEINDSGGIDGRTVTVSFQDDQGNPTNAVSLLESSISSDRPDAVVAGSSSDETLAMLPVLTRDKIMNIGNTSSVQINNPSKYPYTFRPNDPNTALAGFTAQSFKQKGYKKVVILEPDDAAGISNGDANESALTAAGLKVSVVQFDPTSLDLTSTLAQAQAQHPDALFAPSAGPGTTSGLIVDARYKVEMTATPLYFDDGLTADVTKLVKPAELGNTFVSTIAISVNQPGERGGLPSVQSFLSSLEKYGPIDITLEASTTIADSLELLQVAANAAKSIDPDKMKAALESLPSQPADTWLTYAQIKFTPTDHFNTVTDPSDFITAPIGRLENGQSQPGKL